MPIYTTVVSGSGTNRSIGLNQGGVAAHFTGSLHVFSGSWPGQRALNITGSVAASSDILIGGDIKTFVKAGPGTGESIHTAMSFEKNTATPDLTLAGNLQIDGNNIKDSGGNNQVTFTAGSQTSFAYDIDITGTGSAAAFQVGTDPDGNRAPDAGYPLRVSNDEGDVGIQIDAKNNKVSSLLFCENGAATGTGWFVDYGADTVNRASFRRSSDDQGQGALVIHDTMKTVRVGGGDYTDGYDDDASLLVTSSAYNRPSMIRLRTKHGSRSTQAYPVISWMHEGALSNNTGHWAMGIDPTSVGDGDTEGEYLRICATGPGSTAMTAGTISMTFRAGGSDAAVGVGGITAGRQLIPTGTLHVENGRTAAYSLTQDLEKAQLFLGNSGNSTGDITAGMWMDVSNDPDIEKHTAHIVAANTSTRAGHKGYLSVGLYDGSGNVNSTRSRLRIDDQGAALFISASRPQAGGGFPRNADSYYDISSMDVPSGSITAISLMDGTYGKDPATINLVSWKGSNGNKGSVTTGDNLGRIAWVSNDSNFGSTAAANDERGSAVAAYIESIATDSHDDTNFAPGSLDFYVRGAGQTSPQKMLTLQTGSMMLTGTLHIERDISVPVGGQIVDKFNNAYMKFSPGDGTTFTQVIDHLKVAGTTPKITLGDGGDEDIMLLYNSNTNDYYIGSDATDDKLHIGVGTVAGSTPAITIDSASETYIAQNLHVTSNTIKDSGGNNVLTFDGSGAVNGLTTFNSGIMFADVGDYIYGPGSAAAIQFNASQAVSLLGVTTFNNDIIVAGGDIHGATDSVLSLRADTNMRFYIDDDGGGTGNEFQWWDDNIERMVLDQSGNLQIDGDLTVSGNTIKASDGGSTITLDTSDNVTIGGDLTVSGGDIHGVDDGALSLRADTNMRFYIDDDGGGTGNEFQWYDDAIERMVLDQSGNLQIDGNITVSGNVIKASDGGSTITLDTSDNVTIGGNLQTATIAYTNGDSAITIADGGYTKYTAGAQNAGGIMVSDDENAGDNEWCKFAMATPSTATAEGTFIVNMGGAMSYQYIKSSTYIIFAKVSDNSANNMILTAEPLSRGENGPGDNDDTWDPTTDLACTWTDNTAELWIKTTTTNVGCWVTALSGPSEDGLRIAPWHIPIGTDQEGWLASIDSLGTITYGTWSEKIFSKITSPTVVTDIIESDSTNITLDAPSDIILDADGGQIYFKDNGSTYMTFNVDGTTDSIDVTGDLELDVSGNITLDADGGTVYFRDGAAIRGYINSTKIDSSGDVDADDDVWVRGIAYNSSHTDSQYVKIYYQNQGSNTWKLLRYTSTAKVKKNIVDMPNQPGLEHILQLNPRMWDSKNGNETECKGFIAEEVYAIHPEFAALGPDFAYDFDAGTTLRKRITDPDTGVVTVENIYDSDELVPNNIIELNIQIGLINSIKELKEQNDVLIARITALENS